MGQAAALMVTVMFFRRHLVAAARLMAHRVGWAKIRRHGQAMGLLGKGQQSGQHKAEGQNLSQI